MGRDSRHEHSTAFGVLDDCWGHEVEGLKEGQGVSLLRGRWAIVKRSLHCFPRGRKSSVMFKQ